MWVVGEGYEVGWRGVASSSRGSAGRVVPLDPGGRPGQTGPSTYRSEADGEQKY